MLARCREILVPPMIILLLLCLVSNSAFADSQPDAAGQGESASTGLSVFKMIAYEPISELSGLVKSRRFPGVIWAHNDSGDTPRIFALDENMDVIFPGFLGGTYFASLPEAGKTLWPGHTIQLAANLDWEDIAVDEDYIYIADTGNNGNARRDLGVYVIPEPNPRAVAATRSLLYLPVRYPEQEAFPAREWHFDNEAIFVADGSLYFLTKHRQAGKIGAWEAGANLYRLDSRHTDSYNLLRKVDSNKDVQVVTGADLSPDGKYLAVLGYTQLWVFEQPGKSGRWLSGKSHMKQLDPRVTGQVEAICWLDNQTLLIGSEGRQIYKATLTEIKSASNDAQ